MQLFPTSRHFISLWSKYSPQHPVLKHPQSMFLSWCQRPSFTSIQNHRQNLVLCNIIVTISSVMSIYSCFPLSFHYFILTLSLMLRDFVFLCRHFFSLFVIIQTRVVLPFSSGKSWRKTKFVIYVWWKLTVPP
jgi:hypothetical protein